MSHNNIAPESTPVAVSDPGEKLREEHYFLDRMMIGIGNVVAWIFPILMIAIVSQVILRKAGNNQAWLDDAQWWLYGFAMIAGFGYAITTNSHVRVDIFHQGFSERTKARLEVFAIGWLLLPFIAMMVEIMGQYALASWVAKEGSDSPNGLHRLYLLKISMPILLAVAGFAAWSMLRRNLNKYTTPTLFKCILASFPFCLFVANRLTYAAYYVYFRITQPDLKPRRISKEPLMEYTTITAAVILLLLLAFLWFLNRSRKVH